MKKQNEQPQKLTKEHLYLIVLIVTVIPLFFINENNEQPSLLFYLSFFTFGINLFLFLRSRFFLKLDNPYKMRLIILFSLSSSIWFFFHCLFKSSPSLGFNTFVFINKITKSISDLHSFNTSAVSFFIANFTLFTIGIVELLVNRKKIIPFYRYIYIISISFCFYIVLNYIVLFPNIITAKPKVSLIKNTEEIIIDTNQNWDLYFNGEKFEINYDSISYEWYYNDKYFKIGRNCELNNFGNYQVFMITKFGKIKSDILSVNEQNK